MGADASIEGFESCFSNVRHLSLDRFCINRNSYDNMPFLSNLIELKVRTDGLFEDPSKIVNKCDSLKQLLIRYNSNVFSKIELKNPLSNLYLCQPE